MLATKLGTKRVGRGGAGLLVLLLVAAWLLFRGDAQAPGDSSVGADAPLLGEQSPAARVSPAPGVSLPPLPGLLAGLAEGSIPLAGAAGAGDAPAVPVGEGRPLGELTVPGLSPPSPAESTAPVAPLHVPGGGPLTPAPLDPPAGPSHGGAPSGSDDPAPVGPRGPGAGSAAPTPAATSPQRAEEKSRLAPAYTGSTTYFGTALSSSDGSIAEALARNDRLFGRLGVVRQFDPTVPPDGAWSRRTVLNDRVLSTSFREPPAEILAGRHDAALLAYFREAPTRRPIFWTYFHEPEPHIDRGEFTRAEYRQAWRHVVRLAAQARKPNLYPTLILTGWTADPASRRDWRSYYPGDDYISVVAWDPYNSATRRPTTYREPSQLFAHVLRASRSSGKPWAIAETGTMKVAGDDGSGRAAWLTRTGQFFEREGAAFVTYFQSTRDGDFKLTDQPSVAAWAEFVRRTSP